MRGRLSWTSPKSSMILLVATFYGEAPPWEYVEARLGVLRFKYKMGDFSIPVLGIKDIPYDEESGLLEASLSREQFWRRVDRADESWLIFPYAGSGEAEEIAHFLRLTLGGRKVATIEALEEAL